LNSSKKNQADNEAMILPDSLSKIEIDSLCEQAKKTLGGDVADPDYKLAQSYLEICAHGHDVEAATILGYHLIKGFKIEKNTERGVFYLNRSVEGGNEDAMLYLSDYFFEVNKTKESIQLLEKAHKLGNDIATSTLSEIYLKGRNPRLGQPWITNRDLLNPEKGLQYLMQASQTLIDAKFSLAICYLQGVEGYLSADTTKAIRVMEEIIDDPQLDNIPGFRDRVEMKLDEIKSHN
jgi:hypothetical protein